MKFDPPTAELYRDYLAALKRIPTADELLQRIADEYSAVREKHGGLPCYAILYELLRIANKVLEEEFSIPPPQQKHELDEARYRERLHGSIKSTGYIEHIVDKILVSLIAFSNHLPPIALQHDESAYTAPLTSVLVDVKQAAEVLAFGFDDPNCFHRWRRTIRRNEERVKKNFDLDTFLEDTPFRAIFDAQIPFSIPEATYRKHGIILAPPGHGKTQLLGTLIARFLGTSAPLIVLDPHGDLFETLRQRVDPSRLILLDPDTNPPALNFLDFGNASQVEILQTFTYLMSSLSGGLSDKQGAVVPYLLKLLQKIPNASIETLRLLVDEKVKKPSDSQFYDKIKSLDVVDQGFFEHQFYSGRMQETKDAIGWKLYAALTSDAFREMFSAPKNEFDASAAIRDKKIVLVKGSERTLGETGLPVFLQFIVSQFFLAALKRAAIPEKDRHLAVIFADEASHIFNHQTTRILTECRKYGLGFLAATQLIEQIPTEVKAAVYGATAIKIAGPVSHTDAQLLAREMHATGDFIRSLKAVERSHAEFAFYVSGLTDKAVRVTVPYGTLEALPRINTAPYVPKPKAAKPETLSPPAPPDDDIVW